MKKVLAFILCACMLLGLAACGKTDSGSSQKTTSNEQPAESKVETSKATSEGGAAADSGEIKAVGPNGEKAVLATELSLTDEEIEKVKAGNYTAAISLHYGGNDWSTSQIAGLTDTFEKLGIKIVATTDADFSPERQVSDLESIMAKKPDILVSIPVDATSTADAFKRVAESGTKIVFMDNVPVGFTAGVDYVSSVSADNYGNGIIAADLIGEALNGKGKVGVVYYDVDYFVTNQRLEGFEKEMAEKYPDIEIVSKQGFQHENKCDEVADVMLTQHPDINAIFAHWDIPAEGVLSALNAAGRNDVLLSTIDLGNNIAKEIARGRVLGVGAQMPYDQGVAEATLAAYALLGKEAPAYVAVPAKRVDQSNIAEGYEQVYHTSAPDWLKAE